MPDDLSAIVGTLDFQRILIAGSSAIGNGHLLALRKYSTTTVPLSPPMMPEGQRGAALQ